ncbi:hypothetical protein [Agarilytica rhodophyticola]|uniref:hypothetical protein n=1 Tax=Agarilytica rhodophyticola TaxID=1737490 RepID=UPI001FE6F942|nr:hypothetical protein [Agarilytica rhodophyticola]
MIRKAEPLARGSRVILWDTNKDHRKYQGTTVYGFNKPAKFFDALRRSVESGKGFKIAYTGEGDTELFEDFCAVIWSVLDGNKETHVVAEEYGAACEGAGPIQIKRHPYHKKCWQEGRKYNLIWQATSQRPQSISKDAVENAGIIWAGSMGLNAAKRVGAEIDVKVDQLRALRVGEFYRWDISGDTEKVKVFTPKK